MSIYCLIGQSASGKSTVEKTLEVLGYPRIISYTTRPMRDNENNGVDYHYISAEMFHNLTDQGFFAETASYREWYYGLSLDDIDYENQDYITVVTIHGYEELVKVAGHKNVVGIHIKVDERERMIRQLNRGDEVDEVIRRVFTDRIDFAEVEDVCDHIVVNEDILTTTSIIQHIISIKA